MTFDRLCSLITENKTPIVFFGKRGAGVLIYCKKTRRFLLGKRAHNAQEPGTWGLFGGAINNDHETANQAAMRELEEEINYTGEVHLYTLDIYRNGSFSYHNFLGIVPEEFDADLDWENTQAKWFKLDEFPTPLHFGVARLIPKLKHKKLNESVKIISEAKIENLDLEKAYNLFYKEYTTATGKAWPREKFYAKAQNWDFYGDDQGFIAIRPQQSGFFKLVATAGNRKSQYKALLEIAPVLPLWGMVSADIRNLLIKRGFKEPNFIERQFLIKMLQTNKVVGGEITKFNTNGGVEMNLPDIGPTVKYFIGTDLYWKKLYSMKHLFPKNNK